MNKFRPLSLIPQSHKRAFLSRLLPISAIVTTVMLALSGCSTVHVGKRSTSSAILEQRVTVLTGNRLSNDTQSRLMQAGLNSDKCLADMPACIVRLKQSTFNEDKGTYGAYSELFYSAAEQRQQGKNCKTTPQALSTDYAKKLLEVPTNNQAANDEETNEKPQVSCISAYQDNMLQAARFAYIYLMYDLLEQQDNNRANIALANNAVNSIYYLPKERDIQIQDLYYAAIDALGDTMYEKRLKPEYRINDNKIDVMLNQKPFELSQNMRTAKLVSSYQINLTGFNTVSRRDGFGINYVAILDDRYTISIRNQILNHNPNGLSIPERIHAVGHLPVTALLVPKGNSIKDLLTTNNFSLDVYDSYQYKTVPLLNKQFALSANFSAAYGLWLNDNALEPVSIFNMLASSYQNSQPQLFMLEPYNPHKRIIIMLHGLASSPDTWIRLTNDIFSDPMLRDNYQVWQVFYPTNIPILENRLQIAQLLTTAFQQVDPTAKDDASHHAVVIGHSMGGVIGRLLVSNTDLRPALATIVANDQNNVTHNYRHYLNTDDQQAIDTRLQLTSLPEVDRAIFISAPFRGTDYADRWFTRALRRIIALPAGFVNAMSAALTGMFSNDQMINNPLSGLFLENGASQLSDRSFFMQLTKNVQIAEHVRVNTLIATDDHDLYEALNNQNNSNQNTSDNTTASAIPSAAKQPSTTTGASDTASKSLYNTANLNNATQQIAQNNALIEKVQDTASNRLSDGIVPYKSAHLDNVESEKLLPGNHNVHTSPEAILELRRILRRQLQDTGIPSNQAADHMP